MSEWLDRLPDDVQRCLLPSSLGALCWLLACWFVWGVSRWCGHGEPGKRYAAQILLDLLDRPGWNAAWDRQIRRPAGNVTIALWPWPRGLDFVTVGDRRVEACLSGRERRQVGRKARALLRRLTAGTTPEQVSNSLQAIYALRPPNGLAVPAPNQPVPGAGHAGSHFWGPLYAWEEDGTPKEKSHA